MYSNIYESKLIQFHKFRKYLFIGPILFIIGLSSCHDDQTVIEFPYSDGKTLTASVIADSLFVPWEILWGPDDWIWFTQRDGYVKKVHPKTGEIRQLLHLKDNREWTSSGTLGMVLHPDFDTQPYVFLYYTFSTSNEPKDIFGRLVRYHYNIESENLGDPVYYLDTIKHGATGYYGTRLMISDDRKLMACTGGFWQLSGDTISVLGKTLRMELDGSVPEDNPYKGSYVYSRGHRNPQGLTQGRYGNIYIYLNMGLQRMMR
ncbi:MAG: hypothetical protein GY751_04385 [Bacteroidetes bacterium]|nr:hypothetical protein [Bacteroidota bacterium]